MERLVETFTRASYPEARRFRARCITEGCTYESREYWSESPAYLKGWFRNHILDSGHTVEVCEVVPEPAPDEAPAA